jgi:DNA-binding CsgD family transcriptional regulator
MNLLERDPFLTELTTLLHQATTGQGQVVFLSGEAGVGKTSLVKEFCRTVEQKARVAIGACDPLSTPRPLGPLLDVAETLSGLEAVEESSRDQLFRDLLTNLSASKPTLLIFEDVHWADEATLDLLRFLGRRIGNAKALLIATYRDDEVGSKHPLRILLGDVATSSSVRRISLQPLSEKAVRQLAQGSGLDTAQLYQQTGGNPFFITEILAVKSGAMPATIRDAVLARVARLSFSSRAVLEVAAIIGARVESWLLTKVAGAEISAVEGCLDSGMLLVQNDGFMFRHELARQAVLGTILPHRQSVLHTLVFEALKTSPSQDLARLAHHAEAAKNAEAVLEYAPRAAQLSAGLKAHREAVAQYARALRFADGLEPAKRASLIEAYAYECYLTEQLEEAALARQEEALGIWRGLGESQKEGENLRWLSRLNWFLGRNAEAERYALAALEVLQTQPPGLQLAMAYSNLSQLRMLTSDADESIFWGEKAATLAKELGDTATLSHALNNMGTARLCKGEEEGWAQLEESLELALNAGLEEHIARAWTNLVSQAVQAWHFDLAKHYLEEGLGYATEHDLDSWRVYMQGWQSIWLVYQARWDEAVELVASLTRHPTLSPISRIQALLALGRVRTRRGDPEVWTVLDEALQLAIGTNEVQRLGPVRAARAEAFWLGGDTEGAVEEIHAVYDLTLHKRDPSVSSELAYWRWKLEDLKELPAGTLQPFALQIEGNYLEAAAAWKALNCPYEAARALSESDDETALKEALSIFESLGARPMAQWVSRRLRDLGVKGIPRGPRSTTKTNPAGLTTRELEVLHLLAEGQRDKQIARNLNLSEKTVGHHVSAILAKLDKKSRAEAVSEARKLAILPN